MKNHLYRHFDRSGTLLYVGISLSALQRLGQHADHSHWYGSIARVDIEEFSTREEALAAEREAIQNEKPLHNIAHSGVGRVARANDLRRMEESLKALDRSLVVCPVYTLDDARKVLQVSHKAMRRLVEQGRINTFLMPNSTGTKMNVCVSGWQLLDFLESQQASTSSWVGAASEEQLGAMFNGVSVGLQEAGSDD